MGAYDSITQAVELQPDNSYVQAVYALTLDWLGTSSLLLPMNFKVIWLTLPKVSNYAVNLDPNNALALAFRARCWLTNAF